MIPPTKNKVPAMACLSAMQKCIRRLEPTEVDPYEDEAYRLLALKEQTKKCDGATPDLFA